MTESYRTELCARLAPETVRPAGSPGFREERRLDERVAEAHRIGGEPA